MTTNEEKDKTLTILWISYYSLFIVSIFITSGYVSPEASFRIIIPLFYILGIFIFVLSFVIQGNERRF